MKLLKGIFRFLLVLVLIAFIFLGGVRLYIYLSTEGLWLKEGRTPAYTQEDPAEAIIVLGAGVYKDGSLSPILTYRLEKTVELWQSGIAETVLVTGDHRLGEYDEVDHMAEYLVANGVPEECIQKDYSGFSTYESMCRAAAEYHIQKAVVVTQGYHLCRALYIGKAYGMKLAGASAQAPAFGLGNLIREGREWVACAKDIFVCLTDSTIN